MSNYEKMSDKELTEKEQNAYNNWVNCRDSTGTAHRQPGELKDVARQELVDIHKEQERRKQS